MAVFSFLSKYIYIYITVIQRWRALDENFAKYFLKISLTTSSFKVLKCICLELPKSLSQVKSKAKVLWHFRVDPVLKIAVWIYVISSSESVTIFSIFKVIFFRFLNIFEILDLSLINRSFDTAKYPAVQPCRFLWYPSSCIPSSSYPLNPLFLCPCIPAFIFLSIHCINVSCIHIFMYLCIQEFKHPSIQVSKYPSIHISKYPNIQVSKYPSIQISKYQDIQVSKYPSIQVSKYPSI